VDGAESIIDYYSNGKISSEYWYQNCRPHRKDKPAVIAYYPNGNINYERWYVNGLIHRDDGPAYISYYHTGEVYYQIWYQEGVVLSIEIFRLHCLVRGCKKGLESTFKR